MKITFDNLSSLPISLRESELLKALLNDLNEINSKLDKEIYIDWNNEHTEYSPERVDPCPDYYGTYTIRYDKDSTIGSEMDIETLDDFLFLLYDFTVNFMKK
jgi:hypothetical protein